MQESHEQAQPPRSALAVASIALTGYTINLPPTYQAIPTKCAVWTVPVSHSVKTERARLLMKGVQKMPALSFEQLCQGSKTFGA